ncbi:type 1 periplasmic-binding domain-containing protein [Fodinicola feengrottensis]|uniref:substrate-binding domain-containing protein n=1 Tax=Fodinicola feengrottensis TaxID=435914 RepID=UPI0013D10FB3|nr:substrate-binding domain-containing protein [Fodinicola feengrottensis]
MFPSEVSADDVPSGPSGPPVVLFGSASGGAGGDPVVDHVMIDNLGAGQVATGHLVAAGRRRIALIGPAYEPRSRRQAPRVAGYRRALKAAGLTIEKDYTTSSMARCTTGRPARSRWSGCSRCPSRPTPSSA